ncbi:regulatory protein RecX [Clostridium sp. E02]|uniref:regulatory protein RecX n=1 Tax=Clostridium sp. E02 TaxID=2487134 RepID=UPI000F52791B|nr:regulatory protein RecX [Clostridium sp. E02]
MTVTEIVPIDKRRSKVILDEDFTLVLYRGELKKFGVEEGKFITEETYQKIIDDVLRKRARERVFYLLKSSDKTEQELRRKLKDGWYPQEVIDGTMDFLNHHRFINDESYGKRYVEYHSAKRSKRQIQYELQKKGLDKEMIQEIMEEQPVDEEAQVLAYLTKKHFKEKESDAKERSKMMAALGRKGYSYETVARVMARFDCDD